MNRIIATVFTSLGLVTLLSSSLAYAGNQPGAFSVTVGGGELFLAKKRRMDNAGIPFVTFGYDFTCAWGIEALLGGYNTEFRGKPPNNNPHKEINGTMFLIDGIYRFGRVPQTTIEPYLMLGVGVLGMSPNGNDANNEGNVNAAIGAQIFVDEVVAFRIEARDLYTWVGGKNDYMLDAGVSFLFNLC